jgi:glycosyltransferase involved in cell wall biosynthesis
VAVVVPAHNEVRLLPTTLAGLPAWVDHVVVVDDASVDGTDAAARAGGRVEVIRHPVNKGVGGAIVTGYRRALVLGVDAVVVVGADAQMDPGEMPALLDPLVADAADYVKGDRLGHPEVVRRMPWLRLLGNHALSRMTRWATGYRDLMDAQCGYTALSAAMLARLPLDALYARYGFPNDLLARLSDANARVVGCAVTPIYADETSGIRIPRVVAPILWILLRAMGRRVARGLGRQPEPVLSNG